MSLLAFVTEFPSPAQRAEKLLALNERTAPYGLRLSAAHAVALVRSGEEALRSTGRIEWGDGIAPQLIEAFCKRKDKTMIMVTHYESELPDTITNRIFLKRNDTLIY